MSDDNNNNKYKDWPLKNIKEPHDNDVLYGRGGGTNHHPGNKRYRKMVEERKIDYVNAKRLDKPLIALDIIKEWRGQKPPGRFLKQDAKTGLFNDVGDKKAREKTSQALREKAPLIRAQLEGEEDSDDDSEVKATRFADGTKEEGDSKPVLARDHSLGREYLGKDEAVDIEGFSWQEPLKNGERTQSVSSFQSPPPPGDAARFSSYGSYASYGYPYPPPPGMPVDMRHYSNQSWSSMPGVPPPPMPPGWVPSAGGPSGSRDHSFSQFPLPNASIGHPAPHGAFGYYYPPGYYPPPADYPYPRSPSGRAPPRSPQASPQSPDAQYSVDIKVASAWSGQKESDIRRSLSGEEKEIDIPLSPSRVSPVKSTGSPPKPDIAKRMTSNQCETEETKPDLVGPSVKRAALNRDSSRASNRLKELTFPGQFSNGKFDTLREVHELSEDMFRSTLDSPTGEEKNGMDLPPLDGPAPKRLTEEERQSTIDMIAMDLVDKPIRLSSGDRSSTIDALNLDFDEPTLSRPGIMSRTTTVEAVYQELRGDKPATLTLESRLTTDEIVDVLNGPIEEDDDDFLQSRVPIA